MVKMGARGFYKIVIQPILKDWRLFFNLFLHFDFFSFRGSVHFESDVRPLFSKAFVAVLSDELPHHEEEKSQYGNVIRSKL